MITETFVDGKLVSRADDATRIVTTYGETGAVLGTRPYTAAENTAADVAEAERAAQATRESDRTSIVSTALAWLTTDSQQAATRIQQIDTAIGEVDTQISAVQGYTFAGTNISQINASLNTVLKPQLVTLLQRQKGIGQMLRELMVARDKHGDALVWLARYTTSN